MHISPHRNYYELHSPDRFPNRVFAILRTHELMLSDSERVKAYRNAIRMAVKPGDVVLDIGTGLGVLALFAAQAGAKRVYAIEQFGEILDLARRVGDNSRWAGQFIWIRGQAAKVRIREKVDVIVTETLGHYGVEEGIVPNLAVARNRFLKRGGVLIPSLLRLFLAPVQSPRLYEAVNFWRRPLVGLSLSSVASAASTFPLLARVSSSTLLSEPKAIAEIQLGENQSPILNLRTMFRSRRDGIVHGLAGWFSARLTQAVEISNEPGTKYCSWHQLFLPLESALRVRRGNCIRVILELPVSAGSGRWRWHLERY